MTVDRKTAARTLKEIATLLEVGGGNPHRIRAFANAARAVERLEGDFQAMIDNGELLAVRGLGRGTVAVIEELAAERDPEALAEVRGEVPEGVRDLLSIPGLGPKKVRALWKDLGVTTLGELEYACLENRLVELSGFGATTQSRVLEGLRFARRAGERRLMHEARAEAEALGLRLEEVPGIAAAIVAGEVRRGCETVGSIEIVAVTAQESALDGKLGGILGEFERSTDGSWSGTSDSGLPVAIRAADADSAGAAILWATGSYGHLEQLSARASERGTEVWHAGLRRDGEILPCPDEESVYSVLDCAWVPPELREGRDEIDLAAADELPCLVEASDLRGALHNHTTDSDGAASLEEMARAAGELGWRYFGVADHSPAATYANGVDAVRLRDQWRRADELNGRGEGAWVVKGLEADILTDGTLDIPDGCGAGLDYVVASVHSNFRLSEEQQTERIVRAVSDPLCRVLGHPTGRLLLARPGYTVNLGAVLQACAEHHVAVEINASPYRLDLDWRWARRALELGLKLAVSPDAHSIDGLANLRWGLAVARKAGATAADLVNCMPVDDFLAMKNR